MDVRESKFDDVQGEMRLRGKQGKTCCGESAFACCVHEAVCEDGASDPLAFTSRNSALKLAIAARHDCCVSIQLIQESQNTAIETLDTQKHS